MPPVPRDLAGRAKALTLKVYDEIFRTRVLTTAAALAFFFLLAFVPLLLVLAALLAYLPVPNLFGQLMVLLSALVPPDAMTLVYQVMNTVLAPGKAKLISVGLAGSIWAASGGFSACIDALNVAYDVPVGRPWWKDRLQALLLTMTAGALAVTSLIAILLGPQFGHLLTHFFGASLGFSRLWPLLRFGVIFTSFVAALMLLYFLAPNVHQRARSTFPGAVVAVMIFFLGSLGLDFYVSHLTDTNKTYGALGAVIALMLWLYVMAIAILVGAEFNSELMKMVGKPVSNLRWNSANAAVGAVAAPGSGAAPQWSFAGHSAGEVADTSGTEAFSPDLAAKDGLVIPECSIDPS